MMLRYLSEEEMVHMPLHLQVAFLLHLWSKGDQAYVCSYDDYGAVDELSLEGRSATKTY